MLQHRFEFWMVKVDCFANAVQTQDIRLAVKGAKHDRDSAVLLNVSLCLDAGSAEIKIRNRIVTEKHKRIQTFGRDVNVPGRVERSRGNKKHLL